MRNWKAWSIGLMGAGLLAFSVVQAQQVKPATLTPQDYVDIQMLVANYSFALDTAEGDGKAYADLFTPDGRFGDKIVGREAIAKMVSDGHNKSGWKFVNNLITNTLIKVTPEGVIGRQYAVAIDVSSHPDQIYHTGHYEDVYAKTPEGWKFKSRKFVNHSMQAVIPPAGLKAEGK